MALVAFCLLLLSPTALLGVIQTQTHTHSQNKETHILSHTLRFMQWSIKAWYCELWIPCLYQIRALSINTYNTNTHTLTLTHTRRHIDTPTHTHTYTHTHIYIHTY